MRTIALGERINKIFRWEEERKNEHSRWEKEKETNLFSRSEEKIQNYSQEKFLEFERKMGN